MKFRIQFFPENGGTKPRSVNLLSFAHALKVAKTVAELTNEPVRSFMITSEDGSKERWFHLEGAWRQLH